MQPPPCQNGVFIGDPSQPPEAVMLWTDGVSMQLHEVQDGMSLPLEPPPQGGYVLYVGAKVRNMYNCVEERGRLRDPSTLIEYGFDARSATLTVQADGYGWPDPAMNSNVSNVNPCPDYKMQDVQAHNYQMQMVVVDQKTGKQVEVDKPVVPTCMQQDSATQADCICTCSANYTLGKCAPNVDGGTTD
jgi:hypothetical protein